MRMHVPHDSLQALQRGEESNFELALHLVAGFDPTIYTSES